MNVPNLKLILWEKKENVCTPISILDSILVLDLFLLQFSVWLMICFPFIYTIYDNIQSSCAY